jgi:membrane protease YdiL (CAAX protease family)
MSRHEIRRLGEAVTDPAVSLLMLVPLALLHLSGRGGADLEAFFLVESALEQVGDTGTMVLWVGVVVCFLWAVGRVVELQLAWRGGAALIVIEALTWGFLLGPALLILTRWLPLAPAPLVLGVDFGRIHASLAVAAGAGLYEELLFRAVGLGLGARLLHFLFRHFAAEITSRRLSWLIALLLSSAAFAAAHGIHGDPQAFEPDILTFRTVAGLTFGLLFAFRGLAVCAYAHFAYDAFYLLN